MNRDEYFELLEQARQSSQARQDKVALILAKVEGELETRDIGQVSTDILLQYQTELLKIKSLEAIWQTLSASSIYFESSNMALPQKERPFIRNERQNKAYSELGVDDISLQVGHGLLSVCDPKQGSTLIEKVGALRKNLVIELGYVIPNVRVMDQELRRVA